VHVAPIWWQLIKTKASYLMSVFLINYLTTLYQVIKLFWSSATGVIAQADGIL
jgi:hypothetical protein